jgi:tryptophan synthase alpha chain
MNANSRITRRFNLLRAQRRAGLAVFVTAGDPNAEISMEILTRLPGAGADLIELGVPFSDPMADGPAIQISSQRALRAGQTLRRSLEMATAFRKGDAETPIILMGYYNPIYVYGPDKFVEDAATAGVDGLIVVDLPPEEADELRVPAQRAGIDFVFLAAPTTDDVRLPQVLDHAGGFLYYVSIAGVTGTTSAAVATVADAINRIRRSTSLPIAVGFGIKTPAQAAEFAQFADAVVVGSAVIEKITEYLENNGARTPELSDSVIEFVRGIASAVRPPGAEDKGSLS